MPIVRLLSRRHIEIALAYLGGYVLLDWLSYVHPFASFGITPWNPPTGLSFAVVLLFGVKFTPWLFVAPVLADGLVRGFALPLGAELAAALIIGGGYTLATGLLLVPRLSFDPTLGSRHSLILLVSVAAAGTAAVAASYVGMLVAFGVMPAADFGRAALRFWVGDLIGITVLTPFLLVLMTRRRLVPPSWEAFALLVLVLGALWIVFDVAEAFRFQLFYLFFLPVVWTAVRFGLEGVTAGLLLTQVGLIAAIHFTEQSGADVTAYQALMVVLRHQPKDRGELPGVGDGTDGRQEPRRACAQGASDRARRLAEFGAIRSNATAAPTQATETASRAVETFPCLLLGGSEGSH
jgi:integral membrane sensor domain MASE1